MGVDHLGISWLFSLAHIGNSDANPSITSDFLKKTENYHFESCLSDLPLFAIFVHLYGNSYGGVHPHENWCQQSSVC